MNERPWLGTQKVRDRGGGAYQDAYPDDVRQLEIVIKPKAKYFGVVIESKMSFGVQIQHNTVV